MCTIPCDAHISEVAPASDVLFEDALDDLAEEAIVATHVASAGGERLDKWLTGQLPGHSRSEIQRWVEEGLVSSGGRPLKASYRLAAGDEITITVPPPEDYAVEPEPIPLAVVYEDADLLVIDKPAGMVVHPAAGNWHGTLVNAVLYYCPDLAGVGGVQRPGIVHRLDKDTSGLILVAKNAAAHRALCAQFQGREVRKTYLALVYGQVSPPTGEISAPIGRDSQRRKQMAVVSGGRPAVTHYETRQLYRSPGGDRSLYTLIACHPLTGRTHQIRVHLAYVRHPIVADEVYGGRRRLPVSCARQFLHAAEISFRLPGSGAPMHCHAPLPADLQAVLDRLDGWRITG